MACYRSSAVLGASIAPDSMVFISRGAWVSIQQPAVTSQQPVTVGYCKLLHVSIRRFESHMVGKAVFDNRRLHGAQIRVIFAFSFSIGALYVVSTEFLKISHVLKGVVLALSS